MRGGGWGGRGCPCTTSGFRVCLNRAVRLGLGVFRFQISDFKYATLLCYAGPDGACSFADPKSKFQNSGPNTGPLPTKQCSNFRSPRSVQFSQKNRSKNMQNRSQTRQSRSQNLQNRSQNLQNRFQLKPNRSQRWQSSKIRSHISKRPCQLSGKQSKEKIDFTFHIPYGRKRASRNQNSSKEKYPDFSKQNGLSPLLTSAGRGRDGM